MATNHTTNYELNQWLPTDSVLRTDFNGDNAKVDAALKALSDQVVQKASQSAVNTLVTAVNQKADASTVSALAQTVAAKADQTALDQAVSTLTAADRLVFLSQTSVGSSVSAYTLTVPDWTGAWELQLRYNIWGTGDIYLSFNDSAPCYNSETMQIITALRLKYDSRTCGTGVIFLRPCGSSGRISCHVDGLTLDETGNGSFAVDLCCSLNVVTAQTLTQIKFHSDGGTIQTGSGFAFYCVK